MDSHSVYDNYKDQPTFKVEAKPVFDSMIPMARPITCRIWLSKSSTIPLTLLHQETAKDLQHASQPSNGGPQTEPIKIRCSFAPLVFVHNTIAERIRKSLRTTVMTTSARRPQDVEFQLFLHYTTSTVPGVDRENDEHWLVMDADNWLEACRVLMSKRTSTAGLLAIWHEKAPAAAAAVQRETKSLEKDQVDITEHEVEISEKEKHESTAIRGRARSHHGRLPSFLNYRIMF